jgi:hypothetical protein
MKVYSDNLGLSQAHLNSFFDEVFSHVSYICNFKNYSNEIFGVAMTLFHYYTYFKSFYEYDRCEIAVSCVFLACKIEFSFLKADEARQIFCDLKKNQTGKIPNTNNPDLTKFEVDILSFIGYDMNIKTPYKYYYSYFHKYLPNLLLNDQKIFNIGIRILNDAYRSNLCIFHHPKYITLGAIYLTLRLTSEEEEIELAVLSKWDHLINKELLLHCIDSLMVIFENRLK